MRTATAILRLMRPGDWTKNVFVCLAFVFWLANAIKSRSVDSVPEQLQHTLLAFAAFCAVASGFYCINDAIDAPKDRQHPVKRSRPVASGAVAPAAAVGLGCALVAGSMVLSWMVSPRLVWAVAAYAILQALYNLALKRVAFIDVTAIAAGFAMRAAAGAIAIDVRISVWLVLCVFFLCLYLGFIKRMCDLVSAERSGSAWSSPAGYRGRDELQWLLGISAVMTLLMYLSYTLSEHAWMLFGSRATGLALLTPLVMAAIHRFWRRANEGSSDSPLEALRTDRVVLVSILAYVALLGAVLFVPSVGAALDAVFLQREAVR